MLNGRLVEGAPPEDTVHLSNLHDDMGERTNLRDAEPQHTADLTALAQSWRAGIEDRWARDFSPARQGIVTHR